MRQSQLFASTWREAPADAEAASHRLLLRGGFIRQLAAGIYTYLPLGLKVLRNIERIVREEMDDRAGAQELLMPALQPICSPEETRRKGGSPKNCTDNWAAWGSTCFTTTGKSAPA